MATLSLANLGAGAGGGNLGEALRGANRVQQAAFEDAMARSAELPDTAARPGTVDSAAGAAEPAGTPPVAQASEAADVDARERARRTLELDGPKAAVAPSDGDTILGGLSKLRGTFDARHARINEILSSKSVDTNTLLAMQMEVAQYSLLVDVSSKLTGKSTQSLDTLMKGQ
jgi:type III secretion system YscI/HrpB-like protein